MGVFEMVVLIVAIGVFGSVISKYLKTKAENGNLEREAINEDTQRRLTELEQRLIVLEQIVTSESYDLNQQFKQIDKE